jgi:hypothetical protein
MLKPNVGAAAAVCLPLKALAVQIKSNIWLYLSQVNCGTNLTINHAAWLFFANKPI